MSRGPPGRVVGNPSLIDEQFYVLDGVLSVYLDGKWHDLETVELALVPRGTPHAQGNTAREDYRSGRIAQASSALQAMNCRGRETFPLVAECC